MKNKTNKQLNKMYNDFNNLMNINNNIKISDRNKDKLYKDNWRI